MPIIHEHHGSFGSKTTVVETESFTVTVSTAKEGLFKGLSTMIIDGHLLQGRPCGKIIYTPSARKSDRQQFHDWIVKGLEEGGNGGNDLEESLTAIIEFMKEKGLISEAMNIA